MEVRVLSWMPESPKRLVDIPLTSILANATSDHKLKSLGPQNQVKFLIHGFSDMVNIEKIYVLDNNMNLGYKQWPNNFFM